MVHSPLSLLSILTFLIGSVEAAPLSSSSPSTHNTSCSTASSPVRVPIRRRNGLQTGKERREWMKNQGKAMNRKYGRPQKLEKRAGGVGTVEMTDYLDSIWFGDVQIGTPPVAYGFILDTGSSDLIVATPDCIGCPPDTPGFQLSQSSTATNTSEPFEITYGSGAASGYIVEDTVSIAGFTSEKQAFALCNSMDSIVNSSISGILGMGWSSIASSGTTPLVQKIAEQGQLAQQVFAFAFESHTFLVDGPTTAPGGELTIGGVDTTKYSGEINWNELSEEGFWEIPLGGVSVDGQDAGISTPKAIIDTGTTLIGLPQSVMSQLYALVPSSAPANLDGNGGYFSFPCEQEVTLSLTFGGITYTMPPSAFNAGTYDFDEYTCLASVFGLNSERYIIGDAFLTTVYSAFRLSAPPAVGFAILGSGGQPPVNTTMTGPISNQNKDSSTSQLQTPTTLFTVFLASTFLALAIHF